MKRLLILLSIFSLLNISNIKSAGRSAEESKEEKESKESKDKVESPKVGKSAPYSEKDHKVMKELKELQYPTAIASLMVDYLKSKFEYANSFAAHANWIKSLIVLDRTHFASASNDGTIKIWQFRHSTAGTTEKYECIHTLDQNNDGHEHWVFSLINLDETHFVSGSYGTIKIWQFIPGKTPKCIQTLDENNGGHTDWIYSLAKLDDTHFVSGSSDSSIKIWELIPETTPLQYRCIQTLDYRNAGHTTSVFSLVKLDDNHFASASRYGVIKIWQYNPEAVSTTAKYRCIHTLDRNDDGGHTNAVNSLIKLDEKHFASCSDDRTIKIWKLIPATASTPSHLICIQTLDENNGGHTSWVESLMKLDDNRFASGSNAETIKIWQFIPETSSARCIQTLDLYPLRILSMTKMPNGDLIAGLSNGEIYIFKPVPDISFDKKHITLSATQSAQKPILPNATQSPPKVTLPIYLFIKNNRNKIFMLMAALYFIKNRKQIINYLPHLLKYFKPLT